MLRRRVGLEVTRTPDLLAGKYLSYLCYFLLNASHNVHMCRINGTL